MEYLYYFGLNPTEYAKPRTESDRINDPHLAPRQSCRETVFPGAEVLANQRPQSTGALHGYFV